MHEITARLDHDRCNRDDKKVSERIFEIFQDLKVPKLFALTSDYTLQQGRR